MTLERGNAFTPVASATLIWPWRSSVVAGGVAGVLALLTSLNEGVLSALGSGIGSAAFFFALVGGAVGALGSKGDRRARRYAAQYPWRFAMVPALIGGAGAAVGTLLSSGLILGILGGAATAAVLWVILGIITMVAGNKK
ncbi:hypothetical protein JCM3263A_16350 [Thermobifida fusca]|jgi:hypothetical protein|uniref:Uncharacterized protein n=2 Tax=Thermobifida fusca TaxID=2021 RepID=A0A9P2WSB3_THEFU|nr:MULTISPECIES: hypothetical protein [Thermobifida]EOR72736.1 hypothetical protein TM51_00796 [Thermobifida fusca TM51]MBO2530956.1 hypothetical protein [Thermobifida sp.]MDD6792382.1 hypothetical protein [Thermobifida fusca]PPS91541.1 membrane protein [Thermobifida fusca]PZN65269.1 MAG: hypothetical protein DIU53_04230 [Thermobifida fusca]